MNPKPPRRSKATRAYQLLCEATSQLRTLYSYDLLKLARAVHPELGEGAANILILEETRWRDGSLSPSLRTLATGYSSMLYQLRETLVFLREQARESTAVVNDVRLIFSFPYSEKDTRAVWLDCETGRLWRPATVQAMRKYLAEPERTALERRETEIERVLAKAMAALNVETIWIHGVDWREERVIETLEVRRRKDVWSEFETVRVLGTRFHPAGSNIRDAAERAEFLAQHEAERQQLLAA